MTVSLPPLPYDTSALEPHISARTLEFHHGKHHKAYVDKTNALITGTPLESAPLEEIVRKAAAKGDQTLLNQACQAWNHNFLWYCYSPAGGGAPQGGLARALDRDLGGLEAFRKAFAKEAVGHFASGWAWLVADGDTLKITSYHDGDTPIVHGVRPILTLDVWEHAYYLDYQNARPNYVEAFLRHLINWEFAAANFANPDAWREAA